MINNLFLKNNIQEQYLKSKYSIKLSKQFKKIILNIHKDIKSSNTTLNILDSKFKFNFKISDLKKFKKFKTIVFVGMGGSILGTQGIYDFLKFKVKKKIYFFDDLNEKKLLNFKRKQNFKKVLFLIISKSGNTVETLSNTFALNIIKKNSKNVIILSDKKNNFLYSLSKKFDLFYIEHRDYLGGRYSVLSEIGMIPAYLMGLNIFKLRSNASYWLKGKNINFLKDSTIKLASLINSKKYKNLIFLNYSPELEKFLFWCQQLIGESLGKNNKGFFPVISSVPKDHHSLLQLYLDGPKDKLFHIFSFEEKSKQKINLKKINNNQNFLNRKTIGSIKIAQKNALIKALKKNRIPFREFKLKITNEQILGKLFSYFILETVIVAKLLKINPFDQPAVEQVKIYTKELLS